MKSIRLPLEKCKDYEQYKYFVYVGSGRIYFTNKRKGEDYLRELSSVMGDVVRVIVSTHNNTYTTYLNHYFDLKDSENYGTYIKSFHYRLNYSFRQFSQGNEIMAISNVYQLFVISEQFINRLKKAFQKSNKYTVVNNLNGSLMLLDTIRQRFDLLFSQKNIDRVYKQEKFKVIHLKKAVS